MPRATDGTLLRERIHEGGMGVVWRGAQSALALRIPVHIVEPDPAKLPELLTRICDEAHRGAASAAAVIDGFGAPLIAMERVEGVTLADRLSAGARFSRTRAVDLVDKILAALAVIHDAGMVHGELQPETVVIGPDGVSLIDFSGPDAGWLGATEYLAPEVLDGARPTAASDLYAVGAILHELLVEPRLPPSQIDRACARAMSRSPAARFPDARAFAAALR
jgi:serine/threonine protein kinase